MSGDSVGGTVSALQGTAEAFGGQVPVVARLAEIVTAGRGADAGGSSLNSMVEGLVAAVASSLAGFGMTVHGDGRALAKVAESFTRLGGATQGPTGKG